MITCHTVFNVRPKTTLLPVWCRDAKRLDIPGTGSCLLYGLIYYMPVAMPGDNRQSFSFPGPHFSKENTGQLFSQHISSIHASNKIRGWITPTHYTD